MTSSRPDPLCDPTPERTDDVTAAQPFPFARLHALFIVAHADDEVLAAGAHLGSFRKVSMIHTTDGAADRRSARARGFATRVEYARARRAELQAVLAAGRVSADCHELAVRCLEASFRLASMTRQLTRLIGRIAPDIVFTQVYEGGHPDHDATAFAVRAALRRLAAPPPLWELTGYHRAGGRIVRGQFPNAGGAPTVCLTLGPEARARKRRMLDGFRSQLDVVAQFPLDAEMFRIAPEHDFSQAPHAGTLGYEPEGFGMDPRLWRALARVAERQLRPGLGGWLRNWWLDLELWWLIWTQRAHPDHPRLVRLMRSCCILSEIAPSAGDGTRRHAGTPH